MSPLHIDSKTNSPIPPTNIAIVTDLIAHRVRGQPDAPAILCEDEIVTYRDLERRWLSVAAALQARGIQQGDVVALYTDRSAELVSGLLGILSAGAIYLPLDPNYPEERHRFALKDTNCRLILVSDGYDGAVQRKYRVNTLPIKTAELCNDELSPFQSTDNSNAYIIYTSGSTGEPKGVLGLHSSLTTYVGWLTSHVEIDRNDKILNITSISFDPSLRDILCPLVGGATLVLLRQTEVKDPRAYTSAIWRHGITKILSITPTLLRHWCAAEPEIGKSIQIILTCGEILTYELTTLVRRKFGEQVRVINMYGPTECTMTATYYEVEKSLKGKKGVVPIGIPRDGMEVYVFSNECLPIPNGAVGEIYIGGHGLSAGYVNRPDSTQERFLRGLLPDTRQILFRTGDFGCLLPDGVLVYRGRLDDQLKIRGERIEIAEIESVILEAPGVNEAAVVPTFDEHGCSGICAFVTSDGEFADVEKSLYGLTQKRLPTVAIPREILLVPSMPRRPNGKLDRQVLRE